MPDLNIRLHIGTSTHNSKVFNADTGEEIKNVRSIEFKLDSAGSRVPSVTIEFCPIALLCDGEAFGANSTLNEEAAREILGSYSYDLVLKSQVDAERAARA